MPVSRTPVNVGTLDASRQDSWGLWLPARMQRWCRDERVLPTLPSSREGTPPKCRGGSWCMPQFHSLMSGFDVEVTEPWKCWLEATSGGL